MGTYQESSIFEFTNCFADGNSEYTVLVLLQDVDLTKTLLPPAIRAAKRYDGKIVLLNIIDIPYQLPPSEAKQFKLEREFKLEYARQVVMTAGCEVEVMVRVAHRIPYAIEQLASSMDIDLIIMFAKKKGLLWDKEIHQKLYDVNSNLLVAKEKVETHFEEVIIQVDDIKTTSSMIVHATNLLASGEGTIHLMPVSSANDGRRTLKKARSILDGFLSQNPWFTGETSISQLQQKSDIKKYISNMYPQKTDSAGVLVPYSSGKKPGLGTWLKDEAEELNLPVFISKVGRIEPIGIDNLRIKLKNWMGVTF